MGRRHSLAHIGLVVIVVLHAGACGSTAASPPAGTQPVVGPTSTTGVPTFGASPISGTAGTAAPSAGLSTSPSSSIEPAASPSTSAIPSSSWRIVVPPLAVPAVYLDFGFAGNGDLLVVGTDLITDPKLALWIARYAPDGTRKSRKAVDRRIGLINADWIDIDPSTDTVVFLDRQADGSFVTRRVSSATGKTVASVELHDKVVQIAIDAGGRMFGSLPNYSTFSNIRPCLLARLGPKGGVAEGIDILMEPCETRFDVAGVRHFSAPYEIAITGSGNLVFVDQAENEAGSLIGPRIAFVTPAWSFVRGWDLPFEWQPNDPAYGVITSSFILAATADEHVYLGETLAADDGSRSIGTRIRHFGTDGQLLETLGMGGSQDGITWPSHPVVDGADRLWVIDLDTATRSYSIKVLE
jgi:hypothetical protein